MCKRVREMKAISISIIVLINLFCRSYHVNSESDSCASNLQLSIPPPFDITALKCTPAWDTQNFILRYKEGPPKVWSFVLSTPTPDSYIAIGFSSNGQMVGSSAVVGWMSSSGAHIKQYSLDGTSESQVKPDQGTLMFANKTGWIFSQSNRFYLLFQLYTSQPESQIIYAIGPSSFTPSTDDFLLKEHREMISTTVNYVSGTSDSKSRQTNTKLRRAHGVINMLSWGILVVIAAIIARHCKEWDPLWYYLHVGIQIGAFVAGVVGIICGFVLKNKVSANVSIHQNLGIVIVIMGCLQVLAFWIRPDKGSKLRVYWNFYHHNVGRILIILAIANTFYGIHLSEKGYKWNVGYVIVIVALFITSVLLELRMYRKSKSSDMQLSSLDVK